MDDDARTRQDLISEIEDLRKRLGRLESSRDRAPSAESHLLRELEEAREDRARLERLGAQGTDLICEIGEDGTLLFVSENAEKIIGRPAVELLGGSALEGLGLGQVHPDDRGALLKSFSEGIGTERDIQRLYRFNVHGEWRWLTSWGHSAVGTDGVWRSVILTRDVTDREQALQALRRSEERYRHLIESTHDLVAEVDAEGRVVFMSPSCEEVLGLKAEELIGTTPFAMIHPDDVERLAELFLGRVASDRPGTGQGALFRIRHRDGSWRWLEGSGTRFETPEGETHIVAVTRDVTRRVEAEQAQSRLMRRVEQARRFESLGMLATGMAHDFNNLLTPILGAAGLALMDLPSDSPIRSRLERIQRASSEAAALTNQLLEYAGRGSFEAERLELPILLAETEDSLRTAVAGHARLSFEHQASPMSLEADANQLAQLALHLVGNAADAVEEAGGDAGHVTVRTGSARLDEDALSRLFLGEECKPGPYAWLEVEDDGVGMDEATRARIFDPFFTTKLSGRGLGLSVVLGVVRKHRGALEFAAEKGRGSRIRVYLPA